MSGLIRISGGSSSGSTGGGSNTPPTIKNFRSTEQTANTITIKYLAEDIQNAILRHYIYIDGIKKEITDDVKWDKSNNEFTYQLTQLNKEQIYNIQIEVSDSIDIARTDILNISTKNFLVYGISVDETNYNPNTSVKYIDDAIGFTPAFKSNLGSWADKFIIPKIKIVGFKNGSVTKEIDPYNKTQYIDGEVVPSDVDVMAEIPKFYWNFSNTEKGYELRISEDKVDDNYVCYAHQVNNKEKDHIYIGVYQGSESNGKLISKSGVSLNSSSPSKKNISQIRECLKNNGSGYQVFNWFSLMMVQIIFTVMYKSLNFRERMGCSYRGQEITGFGDTKGLFYAGINSGQYGNTNVFCGIEDMPPNFPIFIDGIYEDTNDNDNKIRTVKVNLNNSLFDLYTTNYNFVEKINVYQNETDKTYYGSINKVFHSNELGFWGVEFNGSNNLGYCSDFYYSYSNSTYMSIVTQLSGYGGSGNKGIYALRTNNSFSDINHYYYRLVYLGE